MHVLTAHRGMQVIFKNVFTSAALPRLTVMYAFLRVNMLLD